MKKRLDFSLSLFLNDRVSLIFTTEKPIGTLSVLGKSQLCRLKGAIDAVGPDETL